MAENAAMANAKVLSLLGSLRSVIGQSEDLLTGGEHNATSIKDKFELILFQLERTQALPELPEVFVTMKDMLDTYIKLVSKRKMVATYKKLNYWTKIRGVRKELQRIKTIAEEEAQSLRSLALTYVSGPLSRVPPYLRQFIYYFLVFPVNFEVPTRRLICLWVVEGLVNPNQHGNESVEHIAERYLNELIDLEEVCVTKTKRNGKVKACRLKDGTRDAWLKQANEAKFLQDRNKNVRRLVDHHGSPDAYSIQIHGNPTISQSMRSFRDIISFFSFDTQEGSKPGEDIGDFLHKCISAKCFVRLSVLDLEQVFRPKLPKTIGELIGLKYLGLRWTYLEHLPNFVNKLFNLQVLDVKHTYISILPRSIWSLQYLRHLYLSEVYRTRFPGQPSGISLTALQTLWGAFIDEDTCVTEGLDTSLNIRKLGLSCRSRQSEDYKMLEQLKAIDKWISNLRFLESLRLKSRDKQGKAADLHLTSLEANRNLSTVYLLGKLNPQVVTEFPVTLTDVTLSGSELDLDPMEFLQRLPNLVILRLLANSVTHRKMRCSRRGFRWLKVLCIWKLEKLEEWEAEEGSLPCLEELEFRSCENFKKGPDGLQYVSTLQKLRLEDMPVEFMDEIKKNKSLWEKIEPAPKVEQEQFQIYSEDFLLF